MRGYICNCASIARTLVPEKATVLMLATEVTSEKPILTSVAWNLSQLVSGGYDKNHSVERTQSMDIRTHLSILQQDIRAYHTLGTGRHVWAIVHPEHRDEALLLERPSTVVVKGVAVQSSARRAHVRAVEFARKYDRFLTTGLNRQDGGLYVHSALLDSVTPKEIGAPITLRHAGQPDFVVASARLVTRIQGSPLHYLDFVDPTAPLANPDKLNSLAKDVAHWMFTFHHDVSPKTMARYRVEEQFAKVGASLTRRYEHCDKYEFFVNRTMRDAIQLQQGQLGQGESSDKLHERINRGLERTGATTEAIHDIAMTVGKRLAQILPQDRVGLAHTDLHPGNIITDSTHTNVNGVCDWANGTLAPHSLDFAGIGQARGLLPRVMSHYQQLEQNRGVGQPILAEAVYGLAAMRQLFFAVKAIKSGQDDSLAYFSWQQVGESVRELAAIAPDRYAGLVRHAALPARHSVLPLLPVVPARPMDNSSAEP